MDLQCTEQRMLLTTGRINTTTAKSQLSQIPEKKSPMRCAVPLEMPRVVLSKNWFALHKSYKSGFYIVHYPESERWIGATTTTDL